MAPDRAGVLTRLLRFPGASLVILIAMLIGSIGANHVAEAVALSLATFAALVAGPALLSNLAPRQTEDDLNPALLSMKQATVFVTAVVTVGRVLRVASWGFFAASVGVVIAGIFVARTTLNVAASGVLLAFGFLGCAIAFTALYGLRLGYSIADETSVRQLAALLSSRRTALVLASYAFVIATGISYAVAIIA